MKPYTQIPITRNLNVRLDNDDKIIELQNEIDFCIDEGNVFIYEDDCDKALTFILRALQLLEVEYIWFWSKN